MIALRPSLWVVEHTSVETLTLHMLFRPLTYALILWFRDENYIAHWGQMSEWGDGLESVAVHCLHILWTAFLFVEAVTKQYVVVLSIDIQITNQQRDIYCELHFLFWGVLLGLGWFWSYLYLTVRVHFYFVVVCYEYKYSIKQTVAVISHHSSLPQHSKTAH